MKSTLPEGLSRERIQKRWRGCWRHRFILGRGMVSDDTEHGVFVAQALLERLLRLGRDGEWDVICHKLADAVASGKSVQEFASSLGLQRGVTGYGYHTVPVALYAWLRHSCDYRAGLTAALDCGGDTDTVGAIAGALIGGAVGPKGIPSEWVEGICEWPRSVTLLARVGDQLARQKGEGVVRGPVHYLWPGILLRNVVFLLTVLAHGFRRLAPPY